MGPLESFTMGSAVSLRYDCGSSLRCDPCRSRLLGRL